MNAETAPPTLGTEDVPPGTPPMVRGESGIWAPGTPGNNIQVNPEIRPDIRLSNIGNPKFEFGAGGRGEASPANQGNSSNGEAPATSGEQNGELTNVINALVEELRASREQQQQQFQQTMDLMREMLQQQGRILEMLANDRGGRGNDKEPEETEEKPEEPRRRHRDHIGPREERAAREPKPEEPKEPKKPEESEEPKEPEKPEKPKEPKPEEQEDRRWRQRVWARITDGWHNFRSYIRGEVITEEDQTRRRLFLRRALAALVVFAAGVATTVGVDEAIEHWGGSRGPGLEQHSEGASSSKAFDEWLRQHRLRIVKEFDQKGSGSAVNVGGNHNRVIVNGDEGAAENAQAQQENGEQQGNEEQQEGKEKESLFNPADGHRRTAIEFSEASGLHLGQDAEGHSIIMDRNGQAVVSYADAPEGIAKESGVLSAKADEVLRAKGYHVDYHELQNTNGGDTLFMSEVS